MKDNNQEISTESENDAVGHIYFDWSGGDITVEGGGAMSPEILANCAKMIFVTIGDNWGEDTASLALVLMLKGLGAPLDL